MKIGDNVIYTGHRKEINGKKALVIFIEPQNSLKTSGVVIQIGRLAYWSLPENLKVI